MPIDEKHVSYNMGQLWNRSWPKMGSSPSHFVEPHTLEHTFVEEHPKSPSVSCYGNLNNVTFVRLYRLSAHDTKP